MKNLRILTLVILQLTALSLFAKENVGFEGQEAASALLKASASDCNAPTAEIFLDINNISAGLLNGGDLWWNGSSDPRYEVPKGSNKHSIFAGALWIGGIDPNEQLRVAAMTYRQDGNDFWPGPLDAEGNVTQQVCSDFDRFFEVSVEDIDSIRNLFDADPELNQIDPGIIPESVLGWPGRNNPYFLGVNGFGLPLNKALAPFFDVDGDGVYDPTRGDFPSLGDCKGEPSDVIPDKMIWWIYNDKGNIHTETQGLSIGLEIGVVAFAYATNDDINNMTFYKYFVTNFASTKLDSTYFAQWVDPDLGTFNDDYVGCDTTASLGIVYNGDADDEDAAGYGTEIPMLGVDFFDGPIDEAGNELGMSAFIYYNNDATDFGNPNNATHYYGYMAGVWKNGAPVTFGGNGQDAGGTPTPIMFPGDPSDPTGWSECSNNNPPADRRFLQVSGPFGLEPGAAPNDVIVGVVWVPNVDYPCPSFKKLLTADRKAQGLFGNCFQLVNGPDAPTMAIRELDREIILSIYNESTSNNVNESYDEFDAFLLGTSDPTYTFQGYQIYQLRDATVSSSEFTDPDKAKLIFQVDKQDGIARLINFTEDPDLGYIGEVKVDGLDAGITHSFQVTQDAFRNERLENQKKYFFSVVAYAENTHTDFDPLSPDPDAQLTPYLEGRKNIKNYVAIPHVIDPQNGGTVLNAAFGDGAQIQTIGGTGNGGLYLDLTQESINEILSDGFSPYPTYEVGEGPIGVKVYDPFYLTGHDYEVRMVDTDTDTEVLEFDSEWNATNLALGETYPSANNNYVFIDDQAIPEFNSLSQGFTVSVNQVTEPDPALDVDNATSEFLGAELAYEDGADEWLNFIADGTGFNWIRSGVGGEDYPYDPDAVYSEILGATVAPYSLAGVQGTLAATGGPNFGPAYPVAGETEPPVNTLANLMSIDIVFDPNPENWTRCPVIEMAENNTISLGDADKFDLRDAPSKARDGSESVLERGMSYFPGYAINVETGRRLNMMFGENSFVGSQNGNDMLWNPGSALYTPQGQSFVDFGFPPEFLAPSDIWFAGMHYVYVMFSEYDEGTAVKQQFDDYAATGDVSIKRDIYEQVAWLTLPYAGAGVELASPGEGIVPSKATVKVRVSKPYAWFDNNKDGELESPAYKFSMAGKEPQFGVGEVADSALDQINVVPNPYYAFSSYETNTLDNEIKITNLPATCDITIMTIDGTLIRKFAVNGEGLDYTKGDNFINSVSWDLTNSKAIKVASGMYLIHINAPGLGERTLKWFGVMRPIDLDTF